MSRRQQFFAGLDVGTSKVAVVVLEVSRNSTKVVGVGTSVCEGLSKGVVVDMEATTHAISSAVKEAELASGCDIWSVCVGVKGTYLRGINSQGMTPLETHEITQADVERVMLAARAVPRSSDWDVLQILPQEFVVDGRRGVRQPVGMFGVRLEAWAHVLTAALAPVRNVTKCCERAGLHVTDLVPVYLAVADAVLLDEEKEQGVVLVDVGAGTTGIVVFGGGVVRYTDVLPIGGDHVTNDLAMRLRAPLREARRIKEQLGSLLVGDMPEDRDRNRYVEVTMIGGRPPERVPRGEVVAVIEARMEEIFTLVAKRLIRNGLEREVAGVVLTGGTVLLEGVEGLVEKLLELPVRTVVGTASEKDVDDPAAVGAMGLARFSLRQPDGSPAPIVDGMPFVGRVRKKVTSWLREFV